MNKKTQFIFSLLMAFFMSLIMSGILTAVHKGITPDFLYSWFSGFSVAWPCASVAVFIAGPLARKSAISIVGFLERKPCCCK